MLKDENVLWRAALGYFLRKHRYVVAFSLPMNRQPWMLLTLARYGSFEQSICFQISYFLLKVELFLGWTTRVLWKRARGADPQRGRPVYPDRDDKDLSLLEWSRNPGEISKKRVSVQRQWKDPSISLSISTALTCTFHLVHRPHESDLALYCPPRKLQTTPLRLSDLIDLTFLLGMEGRGKDSWLTLRLSLLTWIGILGSIPPYPLEAPCFLYVQLRF